MSSYRKHITLDPFNAKSVDKAIKELEEYAKEVDKVSKIIAKKLAELGATKADLKFNKTDYIGNKEIKVTPVPTDTGYKIIASGEAVAFIEFGAGITFGSGHPMASQFGFGPGTWNPASGNWKNPNGWVFKDPTGKIVHTFGNHPAQGMFEAMNDILAANIREVFNEAINEV